MDHFMNPRNVGKIEDADGVGEVGNAKCGDIMKIYLKIEDDTVTDVKFNTFGCGSAIASSSMATELIKGKKLDATKHKRAKQSGLFGKPYFHRKSQSIQWKDVSEIRKNEIVLTYEMIMELLETGKHVFPSEEWIQKAEQLGEEQQKQQEKERKREWKARLPEDFEDLSLVEILAKTQFQKTYMDVIVKAVEAEIPEKIVKSYIWDAMDEEEIECQIKIQRILQVSDQS